MESEKSEDYYKMIVENLMQNFIEMHCDAFADDDQSVEEIIAEMDFIDSNITGDDHPEMLNLIMNTYHKVEKQRKGLQQ